MVVVMVFGDRGGGFDGCEVVHGGCYVYMYIFYNLWCF